MPSPFIIIDWKDDFMAALAELVRTSTQAPAASVLIFPHGRAKRYAREAFRKGRRGGPTALPMMLTVEELFDLIADERGIRRQKDAGTLDKVAILHDIVTEIGTGDLAALSGTEFFPWGLRMASIFDECFANAITPTPLQFVDDIVVPFAADILRSFGDVFARYRDRLAASGLSSPSMRAADVAADIDERPELPPSIDGRPVFLCGLGMPNGTENIVFKTLWKAGATVVLQGDASLTDDRPSDAACEPLRRWIDDWHAGRTLYRAAPRTGQDVLYFAGNDLHSQLRELRKDLETDGTCPARRTATVPANEGQQRLSQSPARRTAVVLTHTAPLIPTLRTLATPTCTVSMGYPVRDTLVAGLLDALATLETNRRPDGNVHWRDLTAILRHPYVRALLGIDASAGPMLQGPEASLRSGHTYVDPKDAVAAVCADILTNGEDPGDRIANLLPGIIDTLHGVTTTATAAARLSSLCDILDSIGTEHVSPTDREAICRLRESVVPALDGTVMADRPLSEQLVRDIVTNLIAAERIPFSATSDDSIQVLGMLETRLIGFDRVYLLEATEDRLPGVEEQDALLPDALRNILGLPTAYEREGAVAYTFGRLVAGAAQVRLYWQEGARQGKGTAGTKAKSRFVETLIWRRELQDKRLLSPGQTPLRSSTTRIVCPPPPSADIPRGEAHDALIRRLLASPVSPTTLNLYIQCPVRFAYERLCRIVPPREADEGTTPSAVGTLMHETLQKAFEPYLGRQVPPGEPAIGDVRGIFLRLLDEKDFRSILQADEFVILREAGPEHLRRHLEAMTRPAHILRLEGELKTRLDLCGEMATLYGKLDRIERRGDDVVVLDYKTGSIIPKSKEGFWKDEAFWARAREVVARARADGSSDPFAGDDGDMLREIRDGAVSLQLPCYLHLARQAFGHVGNAAFVPLATDGREIPFFKEGADPAHRAEVLDDRIPTLLRLVLLHMRHSDVFRANPGTHCAYCGAALFCPAAPK